MAEKSLGVYRSSHQLCCSFNVHDQENDQSWYMNSVFEGEKSDVWWRSKCRVGSGVPKERRRPTRIESLGRWIHALCHQIWKMTTEQCGSKWVLLQVTRLRSRSLSFLCSKETFSPDFDRYSPQSGVRIPARRISRWGYWKALKTSHKAEGDFGYWNNHA